MVKGIVMAARHSPRVRAMETADHFMRGFKTASSEHGVAVNFVRGKEGEVRLTQRGQLEAITSASENAGKRKLTGPEVEAALAKINTGEAQEDLLSKADMLSDARMGHLLGHDRRFGRLARLLGSKTKGTTGEDPTVVSIFLRHSINDGDKLTDKGKTLAEQQGSALAKHLLKYVFPVGRDPKSTPTVILHVSHGGGKTPGQLDWTFEQALGKDVKALRGQVMHAEGVVKLGYGDGTVHNLYLRQEGIMHFHPE